MGQIIDVFPCTTVYSKLCTVQILIQNSSIILIVFKIKLHVYIMYLTLKAIPWTLVTISEPNGAIKNAITIRVYALKLIKCYERATRI